jgi:hypothetical protein
MAIKIKDAQDTRGTWFVSIVPILRIWVDGKIDVLGVHSSALEEFPAEWAMHTLDIDHATGKPFFSREFGMMGWHSLFRVLAHGEEIELSLMYKTKVTLRACPELNEEELVALILEHRYPEIDAAEFVSMR